MRKYHKVLVQADEDKTCGNHAVYFCDCTSMRSAFGDKEKPMEVTRVFAYHGNNICAVNDDEKTFYCTCCGYRASSTTAAIHGYRDYFSSLGYEEIDLFPEEE